jgi:ABC-type multidrug transport system fused ATPase/permease subunit
MHMSRRLQTIAHCDLVAVLDQGECVERGSPLQLIDQTPQSRFAAMCGEEVAEIRALAAAP